MRQASWASSVPVAGCGYTVATLPCCAAAARGVASRQASRRVASGSPLNGFPPAAPWRLLPRGDLGGPHRATPRRTGPARRQAGRHAVDADARGDEGGAAWRGAVWRPACCWFSVSSPSWPSRSPSGLGVPLSAEPTRVEHSRRRARGRTLPSRAGAGPLRHVGVGVSPVVAALARSALLGGGVGGREGPPDRAGGAGGPARSQPDRVGSLPSFV